jgi:peptide/nickel transport system substrate-binding protein
MASPTVNRRTLVAGAAALWPARPWARQADSRGPLQIVGPWEVGPLAPASSGHLYTNLQVAETLVNSDDQGRLLPGLAQRWQVSADGLRWRFVLRPTARFHDGTAVTASQVAQVLRRAHGQPGPLRLAPLAGVSADDGAGVVQLALTQPWSLLPALLAHSSTIVLAASAFDHQGQVQHIVGSGPYRVVELAPPQRLRVAWYAGHDGPAPAVQEVAYLSASRPETRALMAEAGQADIALGLDPASQQRLRHSARVQLASVTLPRTVLVKVNAGHPVLQDPRARQALSLALDRDGMARALLRDAEVSARQLFAPTLAGWHQPGLPPLRQDLAAARALWASLGWTPGADGLLQRQGQPLRLTLRTFPDRPELPLLATALQEQWRQCGLQVAVAIGNASEVPARHRDGSLELALLARHYGLVPDPLGTLLQDFAGRGGDWGAMNWQHSGLQQALSALSQQHDGAEAAVHRSTVARVLQEELPLIPVSWYRQTAAVAPRWSGFSLDPLERSYRLTQLRPRQP